MGYFGKDGRRVPEKGMRTFSAQPSYYYTILQPNIDYAMIYDRCRRFGMLSSDFGAENFEKQAVSLLEKLKADEDYAGLINGAHAPFICDNYSAGIDLGSNLENRLLPCVQKSFNERYPEAHFKAVLQSNSKLPNSIEIANGSNYELLLKRMTREPVIGWYFPQALQEYDVKSQRLQMADLVNSKTISICLSGGFDVCAALVGTPELLISEKKYAPILCMSAYVHKDPRLVLLMKSYGPHLEFWCMTQMLAVGVPQVSEQWSGGITIF